MYFNPRSREGSDRGCCMVPMVEVEYFNPRSREGSDVAPDATAAMREISIHAPVKGATACTPSRQQGFSHFNPRSREGSDGKFHKQAALALGISIHAPAKGATSSEPHTPDHTCDFNPRSREGSDQIWTLPVSRVRISIHAPAKGATVMVGLYHHLRQFQSTLP